MAIVRMRGTARTAWAHLSQGGLLKPTAMWDLSSVTLNEFWPASTGMSGNEYLAKTDVRTLLLQVEVQRVPRPVPDEHELAVEIDTTLGALPAGNGDRRYGGIDRMALRDPADGVAVATWTGWWLWFRAQGEGAMEVLREPAPQLIVDQADTLEEAERPPLLEAPEPSSVFRWTARETDTNDHVFSLAYLERAENALADHGVDTSKLHRWRIWFLRPSFLGEAMACEVEQSDGRWLVALRNTKRDEVSAVVRAG